ncbi:MAG: 2OG-Fe(II) oxygenase [Myxococcota bacterium]
MPGVIQPLDIVALRAEFQKAQPFPFIVVDDFLEPEFAREVAAAYPSFSEALDRGFAFDFVNEKKKIQISEADKFPDPVQRLNEAISGPEFLSQLEEITGIENLLADTELAGAGMHVTGPQGRLDVHIDFNLLEERKLHRRLNILIYLNPEWHRSWGGEVELWDRQVKRCHHSLSPVLGRCVVFETSERSFHGVAAVQCPEHQVRKSFAAYYYTKEAPARWDGKFHDTVFRARPDERFRGYVLMPAERAQRAMQQRWAGVKRRIKSIVGAP